MTKSPTDADDAEPTKPSDDSDFGGPADPIQGEASDAQSPGVCSQCGRTIPDANAACPVCHLEPIAPSPGREAVTLGPGRSFRPPDPETLNQHLTGYHVEKLLGRGGMGAVYRGRQLSLDREVAIKVLPPEIANRPGFAERFSREGKLLAKLSHPNIVAVHDVLVGGPYAMLVMELIDGASLREVMSEGTLSPAEALEIVPHLCDALSYAHRRGVMHRDIKPENLLFDADGRIKITDFGLAKMISGGSAGSEQRSEDLDVDLTAGVVGTVHYMAPEQYERPKDVDHRADIYALGVVFYELLTGRLPIGRFDPPSRQVQVDVRLDEVVLRALDHFPDRRYETADDLRQAVNVASSSRDARTPDTQSRDAQTRDTWGNADAQGSASWVEAVSGHVGRRGAAVRDAVRSTRQQVFGSASVTSGSNDTNQPNHFSGDRPVQPPLLGRGRNFMAQQRETRPLVYYVGATLLVGVAMMSLLFAGWVLFFRDDDGMPFVALLAYVSVIIAARYSRYRIIKRELDPSVLTVFNRTLTMLYVPALVGLLLVPAVLPWLPNPRELTEITDYFDWNATPQWGFRMWASIAGVTAVLWMLSLLHLIQPRILGFLFAPRLQDASRFRPAVLFTMLSLFMFLVGIFGMRGVNAPGASRFGIQATDATGM